MTQEHWPSFIYGTAWKEDRTAGFTRQALEAGFRAIDTANQRKHYHEAGVGEGLAEFLNQHPLPRDKLFLQSKFTYQRGQDHRLPYDPNASLPDQVEQSFQSSLKHLGTDYLDSYLLHGPSDYQGLTKDDLQVWRKMEELVDRKLVRFIGVSNFSPAHLLALLDHSRIRPQFCQNRCYAITGWDEDVRRICTENGIIYQGFSLLTANADFLRSPQISDLTKRNDCTPAQLIFAFARQMGMIPLTGTSSAQHLSEDLKSLQLQLDESDLHCIERIGLD